MQQDSRVIGDDSRRLAAEHHTYSLQLETLLAKPYPNEEDEYEAVRLKKMKLRLKDRMEALARGVFHFAAIN